MPIISQIYVKVNNSAKVEAIRVRPNHTLQEISSALCAAAEVSDQGTPTCDAVLKLYSASKSLVPIGPNIPKNSPDTPYNLEVILVPKALHDDAKQKDAFVEKIKATAKILEEMPKLKKDVQDIEKRIRPSHPTGKTDAKMEIPLPSDCEIYSVPSSIISHKPNSDPTVHLAMTRACTYNVDRVKEIMATPRPVFSAAITEHLKHPTFNIWDYTDIELIGLMENMFIELDVVKTFNMNLDVIRRFLARVSVTYNENPFHNFKHCFCVTQMMYGILNVTGTIARLTPLEKLSLICATIGHDLDHPGLNNAYQINANTDLTIVYNDISPLENHHSAVLFTLFRDPKLNILATLTEAQYRDCRKQIINCILATDMAKHGEILAKFKSHATEFNFEDQAQRQLLLQMIIKCSDISNEVRPKHVSEPWVDNLLEEFFCQSDREKKEGLPTAPFMDREKVTKPSAQVGFIGFVMIPLFELVAKVLPNMDEPIIQPIRRAHEYYKSMLETKPAHQLTYFVLTTEIAVYLVLLVPLNFVPVKARKSAMQFGAHILRLESVVWISRILLLIVGAVFADTLMRLQRLDSDLHAKEAHGHDHHHHYETPLEELQFKSKLFYSQRNMYLSLMSLFMTIVLYRRVQDLYLILSLQDAQDTDKITMKALKQQVEIMAGSLPETKKKTESSADVKSTKTVVEEAEIIAGPILRIPQEFGKGNERADVVGDSSKFFESRAFENILEMTSVQQVEQRLQPNAEQLETIYLIAGYSAGIAILWSMPILKHILWPFKVFTVALHEFGHAAVGTCTGARVESITVDPDEGGLTKMRGGNQYLSLPAGYLSSAFFGALMIFCGFNLTASKAAAVFVGISKNWLTRGITIIFIAIIALLWWLPVGNGKALRYFILFLGTMSALYSVWDILEDLVFRKVNESDASAFSRICCRGCMPPQLWGFIWFLISLLFLAVAVVAALYTFKDDGSD
ncbi:High affinity cAMP-specific and IBMX-insensitive 3',5'-cyclic phosphodiesterase 9A [Entophlyctis sp. JEL0112]|nr:High affinity cAMP-specific and IBMX-insensitive 3',5'-cyclic phosphodiesterase 9A [Entophlyctis sp. JEL0112]